MSEASVLYQVYQSIPTEGWVGLGALVAVIAVKAMDWFLSRRTNSAMEAQLIAVAGVTTALIESLSTRIATLEAQRIGIETRQLELESRLNSEVTARHAAEGQVARLLRRVAELVSIMQHHKIEVPAEHQD